MPCSFWSWRQQMTSSNWSCRLTEWTGCPCGGEEPARGYSAQHGYTRQGLTCFENTPNSLHFLLKNKSIDRLLEHSILKELVHRFIFLLIGNQEHNFQHWDQRTQSHSLSLATLFGEQLLKFPHLLSACCQIPSFAVCMPSKSLICNLHALGRDLNPPSERTCSPVKDIIAK